MARLPKVGGDKGDWGNVLNDYLSQSHADDGTLKNDTVGAPQLKPNSVTSAAIADGQVSGAKIADGSVGSAKIQDGAVGTHQLADGSVTATKLQGAGEADGVATLDGNGKLPEAQVPERLSGSELNATFGGRVENWARNFISGPLPRFGVMSTPPTITFGGNASTVKSSYVNGATKVNATSGLLTHLGSQFVTASYGGQSYYAGQHVTAGSGTKSSGNAPLRVRFMTDAPAIDFCFLDMLYGQFDIIVDGQYVRRDRTAVFGNTGNFRYIKCDFGADTVTYSKVASNPSIVAGGSGHAVGDIITMDGGSGNAAGTPLKIKVASAVSGAMVAYDVVDKGAYTTLPTGTFTQIATTGSGTGAQIGASFFHPEHTTRVMRQIELIYSSPAEFFGIVVGDNDVVLPAYANPATPRLAVIGDSITDGTYLQYGGSHMGASIAQKLGMWDRCIISGIGGTGWNAGSTPWSHANRVADFIGYNADIYLFIGSQNDTANAATQAAVTSVLTQLQTARPNAYIVGIGNIMGDSATLAGYIQAGFAAAPNQERIRFLNNQAAGAKWIPSAGQGAWAVAGDGNHPSQAGLDRFAELAASQVYGQIMQMAA